MISIFLHIRDELLCVVDEDGGTITIDRSRAFLNKAKKYAGVLAHIDAVALELQKKGSTLSDCQLVVDTLIDEVERARNDLPSTMTGCGLGTKDTSPQATTVTNPDFKAGAIKTQRKEEIFMSRAERNACKSLVLEEDDDDDNYCANVDVGIAENVAQQKRRRLNPRLKYRNCDFINESAAEFERLGSDQPMIQGSCRASFKLFGKFFLRCGYCSNFECFKEKGSRNTWSYLSVDTSTFSVSLNQHQFYAIFEKLIRSSIFCFLRTLKENGIYRRFLT